jgi:hypothetical protein
VIPHVQHPLKGQVFGRSSGHDLEIARDDDPAHMLIE